MPQTINASLLLDEILAICKTYLKFDGIEGDKLDEDYLKLKVDETIQGILNYCNLYPDQFPPELKYIAAKICTQVYKDASSPEGKVTSIKERERSINFDVSTDVNSISRAISATTELNAYKRLYKLKTKE